MIKKKCDECMLEIYVKLCHISIYKHHFCSRGCKINFQKGKDTWNKGITGYTTSWKGGKMPESGKLKMSKNHFSKTNPEAHMKRYFNSGINKPTRYENIFAQKLRKIGRDFLQQVVINNRYQVDFLVDNTVYEIDGDWHYVRGKLRQEDIKRDIDLVDFGYNIIHIKNREVGNYAF